MGALTHDDAVKAAVENAASSVLPDHPDGGFLERTLELHFVKALGDHYPPDAIRPRWSLKNSSAPLPDWSPQPGPIDIAVDVLRTV